MMPAMSRVRAVTKGGRRVPRVHSFHLTAALILLATVGCGAPPPPPPVSAPPPASAPAPAARPAAPGLVYPKAPRGDVVDELYGTKVPDPYRGLEDLDSPATRAWVKAEERLARTYLDALPGREAIRARLRHLWNYERFGLPHKEGKRYFYAYNPGLKNQSLVYVTEGLHGKPRLLLDPNGLSKDGTVALSGQAVSRDGRLFAYALSDAGSDWKTWHVRDVASGKDLPDVVPWSKFSEAWGGPAGPGG
jgi:prolyl oligopeptidase